MPINKFWLGHLDLNKKVHIYGGGISGLLAAYRFQKEGIDFTLHEKSNRLGGKLQTDLTEHGPVEWAANAIVHSPEVEKLLSDLELTPIAATKGLKKCVYRKGKIQSFPPLSFLELLKVFKNLFRPIPPLSNCSLKEAFTPLLSEEICDEVLTPIFRGVYATGSEDLSATAVIPGLSQFEGLPYHNFFSSKLKNRSPLQSLSFKGGMQEFIDALSKKVRDHCNLNSNTPLQENSLVCTDPHSAAELLKSHPDINNLLNSIESVPIHSSCFVLKDEIKELKGCFGLLFNAKESKNIMGILANHEIFPQREYPKFSYTVISKTKINIDDVPLLTNYKTSLVEQKMFSHSYGLPLYNSNLIKVQKKLDKQEDAAFFGNYTDSISLRKLVELTSS